MCVLGHQDIATCCMFKTATGNTNRYTPFVMPGNIKGHPHKRKQSIIQNINNHVMHALHGNYGARATTHLPFANNQAFKTALYYQLLGTSNPSETQHQNCHKQSQPKHSRQYNQSACWCALQQRALAGCTTPTSYDHEAAASQHESVVMVVVHVAVPMTVQAVRVPSMIVRVRHHGQQRNGCHTKEQHRKLGPARKRLGDVSPAAKPSHGHPGAQVSTAASKVDIVSGRDVPDQPMLSAKQTIPPARAEVCHVRACCCSAT